MASTLQAKLSAMAWHGHGLTVAAFSASTGLSDKRFFVFCTSQTTHSRPRLTQHKASVCCRRRLTAVSALLNGI